VKQTKNIFNADVPYFKGLKRGHADLPATVAILPVPTVTQRPTSANVGRRLELHPVVLAED